MYKLILITFLTTFVTTLLNAHNPKPYAVLGDVIYDNVSRIESLKEIESYKLYKEDIEKYVKEVNATKNLGYALEKTSTNIAKKEYLNSLRTLSKTNDYFFRSAKNKYNESMKKNNYLLFSQIINSGLIDTQKNKKEIIDYYYANKEFINSTGLIDTYLEEDARLKAIKEAQSKHYKTRKQLEEEKIKRIRENDKAQQQRLEEDLQKDLNIKKEKIRETQITELAK